MPQAENKWELKDKNAGVSSYNTGDVSLFGYQSEGNGGFYKLPCNPYLNIKSY
jgi:hypothetical protein